MSKVDLPAGVRMQMLYRFVRRLWKNAGGQDLIEYALMADFVAVAAGALMPGVSGKISTIFSKVASGMTAAASQS
jgi:pilus assembly protein Flp/PilA